ncbi:serine hydrolase [Auritidibacter ignavus]|uniref:serine hydrolase domain-containing protein n=1 Tax=Auritidibacter TaxID=1160973 RepID=UPI00143DE5FC|nr:MULTISPECIES: serine hydrolase domain-containing protein [Auritidibacter]WGH81382.1 serine hydrolase [Auritidibacter ignavus]WGH90597.1 serine hydrolase [Auritidibacter ignavus]WHS35580.1 serine hydrolase domain-containing protein [Auritidibacter ignavus]
MTLDTAIRKNGERLTGAISRRFPVPPTALVAGPELNLTVGNPDQPFWTASIDKVFIATLIAQLFDKGACAPDTSLGKLLPHAEFEFLPAASGVVNARDVTIEHLLSHTSGLPDIILPPRGHHTDCSIQAIEAHPGRIWKVSELLEQAAGLPPVGPPGSKFLYSDTAYLLLIRIIEEATGNSVGEQLSSNIFEPCGMATAAAWVNAGPEQLRALLPSLAPFWLRTPGLDIREAFAPNLTWFNGMGGPASAMDLVRFQRAFHGGDLCDRRWIEFFSTPRNRFTGGVHYGAGMVSLRFSGFFPLLRGYPQPIGGLGYTATHMFYYQHQRTHLILNFHSYRRMPASFNAHIRLARMIRDYG